MRGPGIDRTLTLDYPNNVVFQDFQPSGLYFWQVTVDGKNGGEWLFQIDDNPKLFYEDRSDLLEKMTVILLFNALKFFP